MPDTTTPATDSENKAMSAARSAAAATLRESHLEEYNALLTGEAKARGITWTPRPTKEQRATEEMERLLKEFPHLAEQVTVPTDDGPNSASA